MVVIIIIKSQEDVTLTVFDGFRIGNFVEIAIDNYDL